MQKYRLFDYTRKAQAFRKQLDAVLKVPGVHPPETYLSALYGAHLRRLFKDNISTMHALMQKSNRPRVFSESKSKKKTVTIYEGYDSKMRNLADHLATHHPVVALFLFANAASVLGDRKLDDLRTVIKFLAPPGLQPPVFSILARRSSSPSSSSHDMEVSVFLPPTLFRRPFFTLFLLQSDYSRVNWECEHTDPSCTCFVSGKRLYHDYLRMVGEVCFYILWFFPTTIAKGEEEESNVAQLL